jgi:hypothetical protein
MFLTLEDPRAAIQGSRDPLGVQPIWAGFGRHVVTNLTTVSTSLRGFTILLLARYLTQRLVEEGKAKERDALSIFLRMEQIGAYVRHVAHGATSEIRGIERVRRFVAEGKTTVPIQNDASAMILSDQKTYGLWGLYSVSARVSGISADGPVGLTAEATQFADEQYWSTLKPAKNELYRLLLHGGRLSLRKTNAVFRAVAELLPDRLTRAEKAFYAERLRDARRVTNGVPPGRQALLATLLREHTKISGWTDRQEVQILVRAARRRDEALAARLNKILRLEALIAPAEAAFEYLFARDGQRPAAVAAALREHWGSRVPNLRNPGFGGIRTDIEGVVDNDLTALMSQCDAALAGGDYEEAVRTLLKWNELVMKRRNAAPWIRVASGKLDVRYRGNERELPDADELPELWRNSYFIDALKDITRQIGKGV